MRPTLKSEEVPQIEAWAILFFLGILEFLFSFFVYANEGKMFSSLFIDLLARSAQVLAYLVILVNCLTRFGRITLIELIPDRRGFLLLLIGILIEFWIFGLLVGSEGLRHDYHKTMQEFPAAQYWLAVFIFILGSPFVEEVIFRRYFLEIQLQHYPIGVAILLTAASSTVFHFEFSLPHISWVFCQQVFLSFIYVKSRLGVSVLLHAFINGLILFLSR